jgi:hypothetical protein
MVSGTASDLNAVWGTSLNNVYTVGFDSDSGDGTILHYGGKFMTRARDGHRFRPRRHYEAVPPHPTSLLLDFMARQGILSCTTHPVRHQPQQTTATPTPSATINGTPMVMPTATGLCLAHSEHRTDSTANINANRHTRRRRQMKAIRTGPPLNRHDCSIGASRAARSLQSLKNRLPYRRNLRYVINAQARYTIKIKSLNPYNINI